MITFVREPVLGWRESAACRRADPELFFPIGTTGSALAEIEAAKAICAGCPVRRACLAYALTAGEPYGIWGGYDESERRPLSRQLREVAEMRHEPEARPA